MARPDRLGALAGVVGAAGNVLGVAFLWEVRGAYRPDQLDAWAAASLAHPGATAASALAFVLGLLALSWWALALGRRVRGPAARVAAAAMALSAILNAAGCVTPAVLALHVAPACAGGGCIPVARALLGLTLSLDALFNLLFGAGLLALSLALWRREGRPALGALGLAAGVATVLVSGQVFSDAAARWLAVAGPLWLAWVLATSALLWRGGPRRHEPRGGRHASLAGVG